MNIDVAMSLYFYKPKGRADEAYYWLIRHNRLNSLRMVNLFVISFFSCSLCSRLFASGDEFLLIDARLYCRTCHEQSDIDHVRPGSFIPIWGSVFNPMGSDTDIHPKLLVLGRKKSILIL